MLLIPDPDTAVIDPFTPAQDAEHQLLREGPGHRRGLQPRPALHREEGRGLPHAAPASPTPRTSVPKPSSTSSTRRASTRTSTRATTTSTRSRACGTPVARPSSTAHRTSGTRSAYKEGYFPVPPMDQFQDLRSEMLMTLEQVGHPDRGAAPRGGHRGSGRDRHALRHAGDDGRQAHALQVRREERGARRGQDRDLHAQAAVPGQRLRHARAPVAVEGRRAAVLRREGLRRSLGPGALVHRWPAEARAVAARVHQPDDQLVQAARARATRRRSTSCTRSATGRPRCASRCTRRARRPSASSSGAPTRRATRTSRSRRCSWPASTASRTASSRRRRSTATSTTSRPRSWPRCRRCRARSTRCSTRWRADHEYLLAGGVFTPDVIETWVEYKRENEVDALRLRPHPWEFYLYYDI